MGIKPHRTLEQFECLARLSRKAEHGRKCDITVRIVWITGNRAFRFFNGFIVLPGLQEHRASDLVREWRRVSHGFLQKIFCLNPGTVKPS